MIILSFIISILNVVFLSASSSQTQTPPNIIIIMCDDLGYADVGYQNNTEIITPHIDKLALNGVILKKFFAAGPVCSPTRASVLTGRHYFRTGVLDANFGRLRYAEQTIAYELSNQFKYSTSIFGKWHLGGISEDQKKLRGVLESYPNNFGFDHTFVTRNRVRTWNPYGPNGEDAVKDINPYYLNGKREVNNMVGDDSRIIMDRVLPYIKEQVTANNPFLSLIWFHTPHLPVVAGPEYLEMYEKRQLPANKRHYYGAITAMDEQVGRLHDHLKTLNIEKNTLIWFLSDNGPEIYEQKKNFLGSTGGLRGRKRSLYNGGLMVPSFVYCPNLFNSPSMIEEPTSALDIYPTIVDIIHRHTSNQKRAIDMNDFELPIDGMSILDLLTAQSTTRNKNIPFSYRHPDTTTHALISYPYKLLINLDNPGRKELYNIENDIFESKKLDNQLPDIVNTMTEFLIQWRKNVGDSYNGNDYKVSSYSRKQIVKYDAGKTGKETFQPDFDYAKVERCGSKPVNQCICGKQPGNCLAQKSPKVFGVSRRLLDQNSTYSLPSSDVFLKSFYNSFDNQDIRYANLPYIKKSVFNRKTRFIFIAGLGGTGHHMIKKALAVNNSCHHQCQDAKSIRRYTWSLDRNGKVDNDALFTFKDEKQFLRASNLVRAGYNELVTEKRLK